MATMKDIIQSPLLLALVIGGWKMTGQLAGLGIMLVGLVLLLTALLLYNKPFEEPKDKTKKSK